MSDPSATGGLPDDDTVQERLDAYAEARKKQAERIANIAVAFGKLPTERREDEDLAETVRRAFVVPGDTIELHESEIEAISRRIAELNSAVMAGSLVNEEAAMRAQVAEVEAAAAVRSASATRAAPGLSRVAGERAELTERQRENRARGSDVDSPL